MSTLRCESPANIVDRRTAAKSILSRCVTPHRRPLSSVPADASPSRMGRLRVTRAEFHSLLHDPMRALVTSPELLGRSTQAFLRRMDESTGNAPPASQHLREHDQLENAFFSYAGDMLEGQREGQGTLLRRDGGSTRGTFRDGEMCGMGVITWPDGSVYEGPLEDGEPSGHGTYIGLSSGEHYIGEFMHGLRHGKGELRRRRGDVHTVFTGLFRDGFPHDPNGLLRDVARGVTTKGSILGGRPHGHCLITYRNGAYFEGNVVDGVPSEGLSMFRLPTFDRRGRAHDTDAGLHYTGPLVRGCRAECPNHVILQSGQVELLTAKDERSAVQPIEQFVAAACAEHRVKDRIAAHATNPFFDGFIPVAGGTTLSLSVLLGMDDTVSAAPPAPSVPVAVPSQGGKVRRERHAADGRHPSPRTRFLSVADPYHDYGKSAAPTAKAQAVPTATSVHPLVRRMQARGTLIRGCLTERNRRLRAYLLEVPSKTDPYAVTPETAVRTIPLACGPHALDTARVMDSVMAHYAPPPPSSRRRRSSAFTAEGSRSFVADARPYLSACTRAAADSDATAQLRVLIPPPTGKDAELCVLYICSEDPHVRRALDALPARDEPQFACIPPHPVPESVRALLAERRKGGTVVGARRGSRSTSLSFSPADVSLDAAAAASTAPVPVTDALPTIRPLIIPLRVMPLDRSDLGLLRRRRSTILPAHLQKADESGEDEDEGSDEDLSEGDDTGPPSSSASTAARQ